MQEEDTFPEDLAQEIVFLSKEVDPEQLESGPRKFLSSIIDKIGLQ